MRRAAVVLVAVTGLLLSSVAVAAERWLLPTSDGEVLTLLLLGSDGGPPRNDDLRAARADGFQLLFVSADRQHATFVSIPRDAWVPVTGRGTTRINACLNRGPENCVATVEANFGVQVDGYLLTSMRGFALAIEEHGRLTVDVPQRLAVGGTSVAAGDGQVLKGAEALVYARDRKNRSGGDFGRSRAQAELLAIGHRELVADATPGAVLDAVSVVRRHTVTDIPPAQLVRWGFEALQLPPENVQRELAPARLGTAGAASVVYLEQGAYRLIEDAAADGRVGD
jgi:polyisoprenyl-teichoic acid--peptidoglycan teichoic acid transferase